MLSTGVDKNFEGCGRLTTLSPEAAASTEGGGENESPGPQNAGATRRHVCLPYFSSVFFWGGWRRNGCRGTSRWNCGRALQTEERSFLETFFFPSFQVGFSLPKNLKVKRKFGRRRLPEC